MKALPAGSAGQRAAKPTSDLLEHLRLSYAAFSVFAIVSDVCAVLIASVAAGGIYHWLAFGRAESLEEFWGLGGLLAALTAILMNLRGLYTPDGLLTLRAQIRPIMLNWSGVLLLLLGASFTLKLSDTLSRGWVLSFAIAAPFLIIGQRLLLRRAMQSAIQSGWLKRNKILLITSDSKPTYAVDETLRAHDIVATYVLPRKPDEVHSLLRRVVRASRGSNISEIHLAIDWALWSDIQQSLIELRAVPLPVRLIADGIASDILQCPHQTLCGAVSFELQRAPLTPGERAAKRIFDIAVTTCGLVVLAPVLLAISVAVWIDSPKSILFRQKRGGFNGRAFHILKFRTMRVMEDGATITQATRHDARITCVGTWLRRTSIDELPQLINVLRGDMSLVGPRPHALAHDHEYSKLISNYPFRHHVKPGITGWAQVNGLRGETPTVELMKRRVELDLWYVSNWSLWLDVRILFRTVLEICPSRNVF